MGYIKNTAKKENNNTLKAASWYTISNFLSKVILYLYTPVYARVLSTWEYGQYGNFTSWQTILVSLLSLNLYSTVAMAYLEYEDENRFCEYVSTISILGMLPPAVFVLLAVIFRDRFKSIFGMGGFLLYSLAFYVTFSSVLTVFQAEQRSRIKYRLSSFLTLISSVGSSVLIAVFLSISNNKLNGVIAGSTQGVIIINLCVLIYLLKRKLSFKKEYVKYSLGIALPLVPHVLAGHILGSADKIMISRICGSEFTAYYNIPFTVSMIITLLVTSANNAWVPWFFQRMKSEETDVIKRVIRITIPIFMAATFFLCFFAPEVVRIVGGKNYVASVYIMPPIALSCFFNYLYTLYVNIEFYNKKTFGISIATVISALVNVGLNYVFIHKFGYVAAAYTTLFSSILTLLIHIIIVKRHGWSKIVDTRFNLTMAMICMIICLLTSFIYEYSMIRYIGEGLIVIILVSVIAKYYKVILVYLRGSYHE